MSTGLHIFYVHPPFNKSGYGPDEDGSFAHGALESLATRLIRVSLVQEKAGDDCSLTGRMDIDCTKHWSRGTSYTAMRWKLFNAVDASKWQP